MRREQLLYWITLLETQGIGLRTARRVRESVATWEAARECAERDWLTLGLAPEIARSLDGAVRDARHARDVERIETAGVRYVLDTDGEYPELLREIATPPPVLFYHGTFAASADAVAVVGTRNCTAYGRRVAFDIGRALAQSGMQTVSGLARGVDQAAHEGALAGPGCTVAVLGSGVDCVYPPENQKLADRIANEGGAVLSEFLPWIGPSRHHFPQRNRIISGLCRAVVVVEADRRSGSLITAASALDQNRDVYAVPGSIFSAASRGANELIAAGATPLLSAQDIALQLGGFALRLSEPLATTDTFVEGSPVSDTIAALRRELLRELGAGTQSSADFLAMPAFAHLTAAELGTQLTMLELQGSIQRGADGRFSLTGKP
ncbi:MAG: DNA-processing protein DprA [Bacilli bacterium]